MPALNFETGIAGLSERQASLWGFRSGDRGTHTSRTIMLDELSQLLDAVSSDAGRQEYAEPVTDDNCLGKRRARAGADHPLEVLDYSAKTEEHPVCVAVLSFIGAGRRGREVRTHFSDPPYGWPRDAIDAALVSLFAAGHLRATANGVALQPWQLDQAKIPSTDFRTKTATIDARQRLKLRSLFQKAGVDCKPNEETAAAGRRLSRLDELARSAGGDAPLPKRPDNRHLSELQSRVGNEQLLAILDRHNVLAENVDEWTAAGALAGERVPAFRRIEVLLRHAEGLNMVKEIEPQIAAIVAGRRLLDASDPAPGLGRTLVDALRTALVEAESRHHQAYETERQRLEGTECWRTIEQENRDAILYSQIRVRSRDLVRNPG